MTKSIYEIKNMLVRDRDYLANLRSLSDKGIMDALGHAYAVVAEADPQTKTGLTNQLKRLPYCSGKRLLDRCHTLQHRRVPKTVYIGMRVLLSTVKDPSALYYTAYRGHYWYCKKVDRLMIVMDYNWLINYIDVVTKHEYCNANEMFHK